MNKNKFRVVFNRARGLMMVVAERDCKLVCVSAYH
ncbi:ESPR-type extended signal peptide-containing protein [Methylophaga nitratireducenticrescens]|nr:hypothetical protein CDW43_08945 [Methylophaga nitratireducenticrescens]